jgi:hypothetical protein
VGFKDLEVAGFGLRVFWFQKLEVGTRGGWRDLEVGLKDLEVNPVGSDLRLRIFAKSFESLLGFHHPLRLAAKSLLEALAELLSSWDDVD